MTRAPVAISVPAGSEYVHILRAVARNVAVDTGMSTRFVDDVASAIDEAATLILDRKLVTGLLLRLEPSDHHVGVTLNGRDTDESHEWTEWRDNTATTRLSALAEGVCLEVGDDGPCVRFSKRKSR